MSFTKQTPTKPGAYWWKQRPDQCALLVERFKDGTYRMAGTGIIYNVDMLECGEWCGPLVPAEDLAKAQAQCAAMRFVLEQFAEIEVHGQPTALALQAASALSPDCGRDYVHRSEVDMLKIEVQKMASQEMKEGTVRFVATRVS